MAVVILLLLLADFFSVAIIVFDIYFFREWYVYKDTINFGFARHCLYGAIALTAFSMCGKLSMTWLFSKSRKGEDEPKQEKLPSQKLRRPDGTEISIQFTGNMEGQPILFVHGWNEDANAWYYQKQFFRSEYRIILIDLPGLGKSKGPDNKDYSLIKMANDLNAVIEYLQLDNVILWGHSIGGMVILTYCTKLGLNIEKKIKAVILQHTTYTDPTRTSVLNKLLTAIRRPVLYAICYIMIALWPVFWISKWASYFNGNLLLFTRFSTFAGTQTHQQLEFISRLAVMARPDVFARGMLGMMKTYDVTNDLKNIKVPVLIFGSVSDRLTKLSASQFMNQQIPRSKLIILSPAGHQGLIERHTETNEAARDFIEQLTSLSVTIPNPAKPELSV